MESIRRSLVVLVLAGASIAAGFFGFNLVQNVQFARAEDRVEATREQLAQVEDLASVFRHVGKVVEPSVVNIQVRKTVKGVQRHMPFDEDMLRRFFPDRDGDGEPDLPPGFDQQMPEFDQMGTGSGVIMETENGAGYIVTNNHVAGGADEMTITLHDGREITKAKVVGADPKTDLALIRIEADRLIPAKWGNSDELEKGDWIMAFGSPFGYVGSMTHGIVSALNRQAGIIDRGQGYENFIQVDAPINPGNSGGPLVNIRGEVVGINTAIASRTGGFQGVGFAIPSNQAKFVYGQLKSEGKVVRGWLGVSISDVSKDIPKARSFGYEGNSGVLVEQTFADTPATGKLEPGDIIVEADGKPVDNVQQLRNFVAVTAPGTEMKMKVFREGKKRDVTITIGEQPQDLLAAARPGMGGGATNGASASIESLGLKLTTLTKELAERFGVTELQSGALISNVERSSPAARAGLQPGDVITRVDNQDVGTARQATDAIAKHDLKQGVRLYITNRQGSRFVFLRTTAE